MIISRVASNPRNRSIFFIQYNLFLSADKKDILFISWHNLWQNIRENFYHKREWVDERCI